MSDYVLSYHQSLEYTEVYFMEQAENEKGKLFFFLYFRRILADY